MADFLRNQLPFKISVLVFIRNQEGKLLMIERRKSPNFGCWSPIGGKLEMSEGESPFECAIREVKEEANFTISESDLHLFGYISEKSFEGNGHWLMFLFNCNAALDRLPEGIDEGRFSFFTREEIDSIKVPPSDRSLLWPYYDSHRDRFVALRANCHPDSPLEIKLEQSF